jgi:hypothetical protein
MQTINTYLYDNTVEVQILDTSIFTVRNRKVYSRPVTVYQGIDNPIQVIVKNQDQKKVDLTGYAMQADIQDPTNKITVMSYAVTWANIQQGLGQFTIDSTTLNSLEQRFYKLTFRTIKTSDNSQKPTYIDDNYGVPLDLEVLPGYYENVEGVPAENGYVVDGGAI